MSEYDVAKAFQRIERELIASMIRNLKHHQAEETALGYNWSQWQVEQLSALREYQRHNRDKYGTQFVGINRTIEALIRGAYTDGQSEQERELLRAVAQGAIIAPDATMQARFFTVNQRKLDAIVNATTHDVAQAETAVLRLANDQYRKIIFNAQVYANSGAGTYAQAVDMATHDFLVAGLNCVTYSNGARHTLSDYADMAIRTASKRAYLQGEGTKRQEWGIHTVILNKRTNACPHCAKFAGRVFIDDVWSGGTATESQRSGYPLLSSAIEQGLYHPRCKDSHTTFFEGVTDEPEMVTADELKRLEEIEQAEARKQYAERQGAKFERLAGFSLDGENRERYNELAEKWKTYLSNGKPVPTIAGVKCGKPMTHEQADSFNVNPNYGKDIGYAGNCQSCCPVFEARRRGYNIIAKPNYDKRGTTAWALSSSTNLAYIDPKTGRHPEYMCDTSVTNAKKCLSWLKSIVKQNERYSIEFDWKGRGSVGHIINMDLTETGELRFTDNQRGLGEKHEWIGDKAVFRYLSGIKYTRTFYGLRAYAGPKVLRLDNLDFDFSIMNDISEAAK